MDSRTSDDAASCLSDQSERDSEKISEARSCAPAATRAHSAVATVTQADVERMMARHQYREETRRIVKNERLLPAGLLHRLQSLYPQHSSLL